MKKRQQEVVRTSIKRYQVTDHLNVLKLRNPISWRECKDPQEWLGAFRTESDKIGNLDNMHLLNVPKGK